MKRSFLNLLAILLLVLAPFASLAMAQKIDYRIITIPISKSDYYQFGGYLPSGKVSKEFLCFSNFTFEYVSSGKSTKNSAKIVGNLGIKLPASNSIGCDFSKGIDYQFEEFAVSKKTITFKTEKKDNIHFSFTGTYLKKGDLVRFNRKKITVLAGTLTKYLDSKKVAEAKMRFFYVVWEANYYVPPQIIN